MSKYLHNSDDLTKDLVILLSVINNSKLNYETAKSLPHQFNLFTYYTEWNIIQELLISASVRIRLIDDQFILHNKVITYPYDSVGELITSSGSNSLSLREACNKIIHAKKYVPKSCGKEKDSYFFPEITLKGLLKKENWEAHIEINKFVYNAMQQAREYDEDWKISSRI